MNRVTTPMIHVATPSKLECPPSVAMRHLDVLADDTPNAITAEEIAGLRPTEREDLVLSKIDQALGMTPGTELLGDDLARSLGQRLEVGANLVGNALTRAAIQGQYEVRFGSHRDTGKMGVAILSISRRQQVPSSTNGS